MARRKKRSGSPSQLHPLTAAVLLGLSAPPSPAAALAALDWSVPLVSPPGSFQGAAYKMLDSTRFLDRTGWRPRIDLEAGLRRLVAAEYAER